MAKKLFAASVTVTINAIVTVEAENAAEARMLIKGDGYIRHVHYANNAGRDCVATRNPLRKRVKFRRPENVDHLLKKSPHVARSGVIREVKWSDFDEGGCMEDMDQGCPW